MTAEPPVLPAGTFTDWLDDTRRVRAEGADAEVPCGECTACCTSWQFILIAPDEAETIAQIPRKLLFPAPGMPDGHRVLGYDRNGHCPMLVDGLCSIYDHRPRTCREYDCRVFPAAGYSPDDPALSDITEQAARWRFDHPSDEDERSHDAVKAAARFLEAHRAELPPDLVPNRATQRALLAVAIHRLFLGGEPSMGEVADAVVSVAGR